MFGRLNRRPGGRFCCGRSFPAATALVVLVGCNVTGSWRTVRVEPPSARFPIESITLDRDGSFTATGREGEERRTSIGRYRFNGFTLLLEPSATAATKFSARLAGGGSLVLIDRSGAETVSATFTRIGE